MTSKKNKQDYGKCIFRPSRANQKVCVASAATPWGFCNKHNRTAQSKEARTKYDEEQQKQYEKDLLELEKELESDYEVNEELNAHEKNSNDEESSRANTNTSADRIKIVPNSWGRFEDTNTGILFNPDTKSAYGIQGGDGEVYDLDEGAIKVCIENGWSYVPPKEVMVGSTEDEDPEENYEGEEIEFVEEDE